MAEKPNHNSQICDLTNNDFPDQQNSDSDKIPTTADNSSEVDMVQKELKRGNIKILCRGRLHTSRYGQNPVLYLQSRSELEQTKFRETLRARSESDRITFYN